MDVSQQSRLCLAESRDQGLRLGLGQRAEVVRGDEAVLTQQRFVDAGQVGIKSADDSNLEAVGK